MKEYNIDKIINDIDFEGNMLKREGNLLLSNNEINVLERYDIKYKKCMSMHELIYLIEDYLDNSYDDALEDLEDVSASIAERNYYMNTNK